MTKAPKNWQKVGYLIPDEIDPEENICVCVPVPKDWGHIRAFLGQLTELSKWLTWEKTGDDKASQAARRWFDITDCVAEEIDEIMSGNCGCGCGGNKKPTNQRVNESGIYQVSYDNGETWVDAPQDDPRVSAVLFPPKPGGITDAKKCEYANSVVGFFEEVMQEELDDLQATGSTATTFFTTLSAILLGLGIFTGGATTVVGAIMSGVIGLFANMLPEDFEDQFTNDVWAELLCIVYCTIGDDGSFDEERWLLTRIKALSEIGGYAGFWLYDHINLVGQAGLTNAARGNYPGTRACDECDCAPIEIEYEGSGFLLENPEPGKWVGTINGGTGHAETFVRRGGGCFLITSWIWNDPHWDAEGVNCDDVTIAPADWDDGTCWKSVKATQAVSSAIFITITVTECP